MSLPRHFAEDAQTQATSVSSGVVANALDVFILKGPGRACEWVVGVDDDGRLTAQAADPRLALRPAVQAQLSFHETGSRPIRQVIAQSLFLFQAHQFELSPDMPGVNDPIFVRGTLVGPIGGGEAPLRRVAGHVTVTRFDLLHGLVAGAPYAFWRIDGAAARSARTFHLLLPADREESLRMGHGAVLTYPLIDGESPARACGNEALVDEILYNVLRAVWRDVAVERPPPLRDPEKLPVPSRRVHEWELTAEGFTIAGDRAVRKRSGLRGLFGGERRRLPAQGNTDTYLELAREVLRQVLWLPVPRIGYLGIDMPGRPPESELPDFLRPTYDPSPGAPGQNTSWIERFVQLQEQRYGSGVDRSGADDT